jgi:hypothetical protein
MSLKPPSSLFEADVRSTFNKMMYNEFMHVVMMGLEWGVQHVYLLLCRSFTYLKHYKY